MLRRARTLVSGGVLLLASAAASLGAQDAPGVGELVQVSIIRPSDVNASWCTAPVTAVEGDTLVLAASRRCPRGVYTTNFRVVRVISGSRLEHAGRGLLTGAIVGGVVSWIATAGSGCRVAGCDDPGPAIVAMSTMTGAFVGTFIGAARPGGYWVDGVGKRPIRIGRLDLHPGLRVSIAAHDH